MTEVLTHVAMSSRQTADRFDELRSPQFWLKLNPGLHVDDTAFIRSAMPVELDDAARNLLDQRMAVEGYFQYVVPPEQQTLPLDAMAQAVRTLLANGLVSPYAFIYDEFWLLFMRQSRVLSRFLGGEFRILPDFWVWHVDPQKGESGWRPHRDKGRISLDQEGRPKSLTMWVPLTQATPMNGCMYILPANRDPGYNTANEEDLKFDYPDIRALPGGPGHVFCWNQAVLHWGSRTSRFAQDARISVALEFQRADVPAFNLPLLNPQQLPSFETRLQLVAKQILQYEHMHSLTPEQAQFARDVLSAAAAKALAGSAPVATPAPVAPAAPAGAAAMPAAVLTAAQASSAPSAGSASNKKDKHKSKPVVVAKEPKIKAGKEPSPYERQLLVTLYSQKQFADAEVCARTMTKQFPRHGFGWKVLGAVLRQQGRTAESLEPMQKAVQIMPTDYEAFNNLGVTLRALGKFEQAVSCYKRAIELKPDYPEPHGNLGDVLRDQGKYQEALASYHRKLKLTPDDGGVLHQVASLSGMTTDRAPDKYVEGVFDDYADRFDAHLQNVLQYDAPGKLVAMVSRHAAPPTEKWDVLDLGCGTGLMGEAVAPLARQLVGVDLSIKMLEKARARQLYQRLLHADLLTMMKGEPASSYDLILAADVFVYIGRLDDVVAEGRRLLRPGGVFAFSIEALEATPDATGVAGDYELQTSGRYRQSAAYIERLAHHNGFTLLDMTPTTIRMDSHKPISGYLVTWRG